MAFDVANRIGKKDWNTVVKYAELLTSLRLVQALKKRDESRV